MRIAWGTFACPDGSTYRQIEVSELSDWPLFERIARALELELDGQWTDRLDGLDERYWDLSARSGRITLHLQHYLGITLYPWAGAAADQASLALLEEAYDVLVVYEPTDRPG